MRSVLIVSLMCICSIQLVQSQTIPDDVPCYDTTWAYSSLSGRCYKSITTTGKVTWDEAVNQCTKVLNSKSNVNVSLAQVRNLNELKVVVELLQNQGNMEGIWLGARRSSSGSPFMWQNPYENVDLSFIEWSGGMGLGDCLQLTIRIDSGLTAADWRTKVNIENKDCLEKMAFYCEHPVPSCGNPPGQFDLTTMEFSPPIAYPRSTVLAKCKEGLFMQVNNAPTSNSQGNVNGSLQHGQYYCDGKRAAPGPSDPLLFQTTFQYSGRDLGRCEPVKCDYSELLLMKPENGILAQARNHITDNIYGPQQVNQFNQYGNVITVRCNSGYMFADRSTEKQVECGLKTGSDTEGAYHGYAGTSLPIPSKCEVTTCLYEQAMIKEDFNMEPYFMINNQTGLWSNVTKHAGKPYAVNAQLRFFCRPGYETVNKGSDFNTTCSGTGSWSPQLIGCIEKTEDLPVSNTGRFESVKEEAKSAKQISSIMFILTFIFLGLIVLLDLTTIGRDVKQLSNNILLQHKRCQRKRQKSKQAKESELTQEQMDTEDNQLRHRLE